MTRRGYAVTNAAGVAIHKLLEDGTASFSGSVSITGTLNPNGDGVTQLGNENNRWSDAHFVQQTVGAIFETGLTTPHIGKHRTGTVLVWGSNKLRISYKKEDSMVIGIVQRDKDQPIVFGAELVLVTGKVRIGDFIVTSNILGHGERAKRKKWFFFNNNLIGKIIAQALENADGESSLIRCMINKI